MKCEKKTRFMSGRETTIFVCRIVYRFQNDNQGAVIEYEICLLS